MPTEGENKPASKKAKKNGYYRTTDNVVVYRTYLPDGTHAQYVAQDVNGKLPEGVKMSEVINDE